MKYQLRKEQDAYCISEEQFSIYTITLVHFGRNAHWLFQILTCISINEENAVLLLAKLLTIYSVVDSE